MKLAFVGFRHGHIMGLYKAAQNHPQVKLVGAAEDDPQTASRLRQEKSVELTHDRIEQLIAHDDCDAIAVGDYFSRRGSIVAAALKAGKHVIADKPICTSLADLEQIELAAGRSGRIVGCLLDLRDTGPYRAMRRHIRAGAVGEVHTVLFTAQHPLLPATRPKWYFEPGKHGGTINDIAVHGIDLIPWMTGRQITGITAARAWNARFGEHPDFQDAAQLMLRLDNSGSVFGDCSYLSPDDLGYTAPQYWRITCHGSDGVIETSYNAKTLTLAGRGDKSVRELPVDESTPGGVLNNFIAEIEGKTDDSALTMRDVFQASRIALRAQQAAVEHESHVAL